MSIVKGLAKVEFHLAKFINTTTNSSGKPIRNYEEPILLSYNVKPVTDSLDFSTYGERLTRMYKAVVPNNETNRLLFKEGSKVYLEGATPSGEVNNGDNGNYLIVGNRPYNYSLHIYFEKLGSKN
jgi:hypothetical protein